MPETKRSLRAHLLIALVCGGCASQGATGEPGDAGPDGGAGTPAPGACTCSLPPDAGPTTHASVTLDCYCALSGDDCRPLEQRISALLAEPNACVRVREYAGCSRTSVESRVGGELGDGPYEVYDSATGAFLGRVSGADSPFPCPFSRQQLIAGYEAGSTALPLSCP